MCLYKIPLHRLRVKLKTWLLGPSFGPVNLFDTLRKTYSDEHYSETMKEPLDKLERRKLEGKQVSRAGGQ